MKKSQGAPPAVGNPDTYGGGQTGNFTPAVQQQGQVAANAAPIAQPSTMPAEAAGAPVAAQQPPPEYLAAQQAQQAMLASPQGQTFQQASMQQPMGGGKSGGLPPQMAAIQGAGMRQGRGDLFAGRRMGKSGAMPPQYASPMQQQAQPQAAAPGALDVIAYQQQMRDQQGQGG